MMTMTMMMMTMTTTMTDLCSGKMKSCAFVFVHTPHICLALTIMFYDKDHGDHDAYDDPANPDDRDSHDNEYDVHKSQPVLQPDIRSR